MYVITKKKYVKDDDVDTEAVHINKGVLDNSITKELESVLKPLNIMEIFFICRKYKICNCKITPNSTIYKVLSIFYTFMLMSVCGFFIFGFSFTLHVNGFEYFLQFCKILFFYQLAINTVINCFINIFRSNQIVLFTLKMQNVYQLLNMTDEIKNLAVSNWWYIVSLHMFHISWITFSYFFFPGLGAAYNITSYCCTILDTNLLYSIRTMKLLILPIEEWVRKIKLTRFDEEESWTTMLKVYKYLLEAYGLFEKKFEILIVVYAIQTTVKALLAIVIRIEIWKATIGSITITEYLIFSSLSLTWIIKNIVLFILLSVESERLYSALEEVQSTCKQFINSNLCSESQKRVCKNIQRLHRTNFKKMCVCGVFYIDAAMSIQLSSIISTYTIVILQFEFL